MPVAQPSRTAVDDAVRRLAEVQAAQGVASQAAAQPPAGEPTLADAVQRAQEAAQRAATQAEAAAQEAATQPGEAPVVPPPPGLEVPPAPNAVYVQGEGWIIPMSREALRALETRADRLSDQMQSAQKRRDDVAQQLEDATNPQVIAGLEERLRVLDARLISLEKEIEANSAQRASMAARLGAQSSSSTREAPSAPPQRSSDWPGIIALFTLTPLAIAYARNIWRRGKAPVSAPVSEQAEARFQQLEQAIDTVAVEIERVAEGQRFVTKLLREGQPVPDFSAQRAGEGAPVRGSREAMP
jgi:hypothetical protein